MLRILQNGGPPRWELQPAGTSHRAAKARLQHLSGAAVDNHLKPFFEGLRLDELTRADCRSFVSHKVDQGKLKPQSINNLLVPRTHAPPGGEDDCTVNPPEAGIRRVKVPKHEAEWYETAEAEKLFKATPKEWRALIGLAVYAGLRQGEILAHKWGDIDWTHNRIHVRRNLQRTHKLRLVDADAPRLAAPKTDAGRRSVPLRPVLRVLLEQHKRAWQSNELNLVFAS